MLLEFTENIYYGLLSVNSSSINYGIFSADPDIGRWQSHWQKLLEEMRRNKESISIILQKSFTTCYNFC